MSKLSEGNMFGLFAVYAGIRRLVGNDQSRKLLKEAGGIDFLLETMEILPEELVVLAKQVPGILPEKERRANIVSLDEIPEDDLPQTTIEDALLTDAPFALRDLIGGFNIPKKYKDVLLGRLDGFTGVNQAEQQGLSVGEISRGNLAMIALKKRRLKKKIEDINDLFD